jgi:hypothetical protein
VIFMADFRDLYARINDSFYDSDRKGDAISYNKLAMIFSEANNQLREHIQDISREEIRKIIQRLEEGEKITTEELKLIRLWIVGDAEYYVEVENNFSDWLSELKRIVDEVNRINEAEPSLETASHLKAMLEDGKRVIYDIIFFLERKERIENFENATRELDKDERDLFIGLLRSKLTSEKL